MSRWLVLEGYGSYAVLHAPTGRVAFTLRQAPSAPYGASFQPTTSDALVELTATGLRALDLNTAATRWQRAFVAGSLDRTEGLATSGDAVVTCGAGIVTALDDRSGATRWTARVPHCGPLLGDARRVYVNMQREFVALDGRTGARLWGVALPPHNLPPPAFPWTAMTGERVVLSSAPDHPVEILDAATGRRALASAPAYFFIEASSIHGDLALVQSALPSTSDAVMISLSTGEALWRSRGLGEGHCVLGDDALYVLSESQDHLLTLDPRSGRERGRQGVAPWSHPGVSRGFDPWMLIPVERRSGDPAPMLAFLEVRPDGHGGAVVHGLAEAPVLPVEHARIEGQILAHGRIAEAPPAFRVRVGDLIVPVDSRGRFTATVQARGSVPVRQEWEAEAALPRCAYREFRVDQLHTMTLWLDGRRRAYEVALPLPSTGCTSSDEID